MRFGVGLPTCREGTAYPVPYVRPQDFATLAARAEELGFYSLWANDHLTTPHVIQATQADAPNFYEPLITYASLTHVTRRLRLVLSVLVLPHRDVVVVAKQLATLDVLTGGRVMLGLGIGAYREEFEAVRPELRGANRGALLEEGIRALQLLFTQRRASLQGTHIRFAEIELAPKPMQRPFPIYVSAHEAAGFRRAGRLGDGLIVAGLARDRIGEARATMTAAAVQAGRDPARLSVHFQIWLSFGRDRAEAEAKLRQSQHFRRTVARDPERSEEKALAQYRAGNLFGHPDDVIQQLREFERLGVAHVGVVFLGSTRDELLADMELFAERVMPAFPEAEPAGGERS